MSESKLFMQAGDLRARSVAVFPADLERRPGITASTARAAHFHPRAWTEQADWGWVDWGLADWG